MPKNTIAVLDIGSAKINCIIALKGANGSFKVIGMGEADYSGFMNGAFLDEKELKYALGLAISNASKSAGFEVKELFVGIPSEFCFCDKELISENFDKKKKITIHDVANIIDKANKLKDDKNYILLSSNPILFCLEHENECVEIIGEKAEFVTAEISLIYVNAKIVTLLNKCFEELGLEFIEYKSSAYVESKYLIKDECEMLVDVGYLSTSVTTVKNNAVNMLCNFALGGGNITADLFEFFKIPFSTAETLKRNVNFEHKPKMTENYIIDGSKYSAQDVNMVVSYKLQQLCKTLQKCISSSSQLINKILITGGGISYIKGIKNYLENLLNLEVEIVFPPIILLNKPHLSSILGLIDDVLQNDEKNSNSFLAKILRR